jgi:hypothetical protein
MKQGDRGYMISRDIRSAKISALITFRDTLKKALSCDRVDSICPIRERGSSGKER